MPKSARRSRQHSPHFRQLMLVPFAALLLSCGGGDSTPTPPAAVGQTVRVTVATTGVSIDADGYTVRLGSRSAAVASSGTAVFDNVTPGTYELRLEGVAGNCRVEGNAVGSITVLASSSAQSAFAVACTVDFADGLSTVACTGLSLAATSGAPLDRIAAGTVPSGFESRLAARVMTPDGETLGYTWFEIDEQGSVQLVAPLHPSGSIAGGDVLIRATDGSVACEPVEFTITPLSPSPGELDAVVDGLQDLVRTQAAVLQTTPAELQSTARQDLDEVLLPLAIVQWLLDHPQNPSSLRRVASGTTADSYPLETIEALLARSGFRDTLAARSAASLQATAPTASTVDPSTCSPMAIGADAQRLSDCMNATVDIVELVQGLADALGPRLGPAALAMKLTGNTQPVLNVLAGLGWAAIQLEARSFALLPATITMVDIELVPERFMEDEPGTGTWSAKVLAQSQGWDVALEGFGALLAESARDALEAVNIETPTLTTDVLRFIYNQVRDYLGSENIEKRAFGPVTVDDEMWSRLEIFDRTPSVEPVTQNIVRPIAVGTTELYVRGAPPGGERKFGGQRFTGIKLVAVDSILIRVEPADTLMAPGTTATFRVTVENAFFPDSIVVSHPTQGTLGRFAPLPGATGQFTLDYTAPENPNVMDPARLKVEHSAMSGARANGPERSGTATIRFGQVEISPRPPCLDTLEEQTFTAAVTGITNQDVVWTTDAGTITQAGRYKAPSARPASGFATIRATSTSDPALLGEIQVPIGCTCNFSFRLGADSFVAEPGDRMVFTSSDNRLTAVSITRPSQSWSLRMIPIDGNPANWPNAPGAWPIRVQGDMGLSDPTDFIFSTDDEFAPLMNLEAYVPRDRVTGSVSGTVAVVSTSNQRMLFFDWWFSIRYAPGEFTCTVPAP